MADYDYNSRPRGWRGERKRAGWGWIVGYGIGGAVIAWVLLERFF